MRASWHKPFEYTALIGRSAPMPAVFAADYWEEFRLKPGFSSKRSQAEVTAMNLESLDWNVDRLYNMSAFKPVMEDDAVLLLSVGGIDFKNGIELLPEEDWAEISQTAGKLTVNKSRAPVPIRVRITSVKKPVIETPPAEKCFYLTISHLEEPKCGQEIVGFLRMILEAFRWENTVEFDTSVSPPRYRILERPSGATTLEKISLRMEEEDTGAARRSIKFKIMDKVSLTEALFKVLACFPGHDVRWEEAHVKVAEGRWEEAIPWLEERHKGPWVHRHHQVARRDWTPELFLKEGEAHEVIPAGFFDFTSRKSGAERPLKGHRVYVDLFREGANWHFAFHHMDEIVLRRRRELIRHALNAHLGNELVSRPPEAIWPGFFPKKILKA